MKSFIPFAALLASVTAHSTFQQLWVNGVDKGGTCIRTPPSNSPVTSVSSNDIRCNVGGSKGVPGLCTVAGMHLSHPQQKARKA
jgi:cellulase